VSDDNLFVRFLGVALLLHETLYAADVGTAFFYKTFAPVFGVRVPRAVKLAFHLTLVATAIWLLVTPESPCARVTLLPVLTACCFAASARLSNHLVVAWFFALCLFADTVTGTSVLAAAAAPILAAVYGASAFSKLNPDYFANDISCGAHLSRTLASVWDFELMRRLFTTRSLALFAIRGIVLAEALLAIGVILAPRKVAAAAITLHVVFGLLCHVHFSAVMTAGIVYIAGLSGEVDVTSLLVATIGGALLGLRFGNWRPYHHAWLAAAGQVCYGIIAVFTLASALPGTVSSPALVRPDLFHNNFAVIIVSLFALNCATPYLGVKQGFSFTMFSNLRPDRWTHCVITRPLFPPLSRYYRVATMSRLPTLASLDKDITARRVASDLLMFEHRKYNLAFLAGAKSLFPELRLTLNVCGGTLSLGELVATAPWWATWCLDPLVLPSDERARVCE
jgi:hypothetical protein